MSACNIDEKTQIFFVWRVRMPIYIYIRFYKALRNITPTMRFPQFVGYIPITLDCADVTQKYLNF